jgi:hypothetical protein
MVFRFIGRYMYGCVDERVCKCKGVNERVCRCPHLHKPRRGFLKHIIKCKKLYRFNNTGNS